MTVTLAIASKVSAAHMVAIVVDMAATEEDMVIEVVTATVQTITRAHMAEATPRPAATTAIPRRLQLRLSLLPRRHHRRQELRLLARIMRPSTRSTMVLGRLVQTRMLHMGDMLREFLDSRIFSEHH